MTYKPNQTKPNQNMDFKAFSFFIYTLNRSKGSYTLLGGELRVMVMVIRNGIGNPSTNSGLFHCVSLWTNTLGKSIFSSLLALLKQLFSKKENTKLKSVFFLLKIDLVSNSARGGRVGLIYTIFSSMAGDIHPSPATRSGAYRHCDLW